MSEAQQILQKWTPKNLSEVRAKIVRWTEGREGPIKYVREALGMEPTDQQQQLLASIGGFVPDGGKYGPSVASGQGVGKSACAAMIITWFLVCFRDSLAHCTAPTERQLHSVLWGELDKMIRNSPFLSSVLEWRATRILVRGESPNWSAVAHTARNIEAVQGKHRKHMLMVADEASGIEDKFLQALLGGLTEPHNIALMISNPTSTYGIYYDSHHKNRHLWDAMKFSARDTPRLVSPAHIARMEAQYGKDSPIVKIRVDGEFPEQSSNSLIGVGSTEAAKERAIFIGQDASWSLGVDPARFGADQTAMAIVHGNNVMYLNREHGMDVVEVAGKVIATLREHPQILRVNVDEIGIGAGVVDVLMHQQGDGNISPEVLICGVNVAEAADDTKEYPRLRDQMWFELGDRMKEGRIAFGPECDPDLVDVMLADCLPVEYHFTVIGQRQVDSKDDIIKKIGHSPDLADALALAWREDTAGIIGFFKWRN
jgi:phage terminase large subunit